MKKKTAGLNADALLAQVEAGKPGFGVNVMKQENELVDVKKTGVIDPARVTKGSSAERGIYRLNRSNHGALIVVDVPEPEAPAAPGGMPGMGMM
ncbi:hypothetical protein KOY48_00250 [Candidatus Minimicrobia naudis]|uniref:Uncharacterized protein n=1 Tax=Candidatus Minimicrobia naudis TaxID=2841263 RepID=A0A8F1MBG8_9BACT|nr:hypothetical protein KOY48_00250 [Candidatus Minimicrobia naudis]